MPALRHLIFRVIRHRKNVLCKYSFVFCFSIAAFIGICFTSPKFAHASKEITLSASTINVEVDEIVEVPVKIDTDGEIVNAVGFNIDFPTENLEGLGPNRTGSAFPFYMVESATRIDCAINGTSGFNGKGLITTLRFKGRVAGPATLSLTNIRVLFAGADIAGFESNQINFTVYGVGQAPTEDQENPNLISINPPTATDPVAGTIQTITQPNGLPEIPNETFGSKAQVTGSTGSTTEQPLQKQESSGGISEASVKGLFSSGSILWTSILPTILLIGVIIFLAVKLYIGERRRHARMEKLFDKQLGTLAALESKVDLIEEGGENGRKRYIEEFELAKHELSEEALATDNVDHKVKNETAQNPAPVAQ